MLKVNMLRWMDVGLEHNKCEPNNNKVPKFLWSGKAFKIVVIFQTFSELSDFLFVRQKAVVT